MKLSSFLSDRGIILVWGDSDPLAVSKWNHFSRSRKSTLIKTGVSFFFLCTESPYSYSEKVHMSLGTFLKRLFPKFCGERCLYLGHDIMRPDVRRRGDVLSLGALWLGGPEESGAKHGGQVMEGHLVDGLLLCHAAGGQRLIHTHKVQVHKSQLRPWTLISTIISGL